jgi:hypothetical protein
VISPLKHTSVSWKIWNENQNIKKKVNKATSLKCSYPKHFCHGNEIKKLQKNSSNINEILKKILRRYQIG